MLGLSAFNPISANLFAYCNNNAVNYVDPIGYGPELVAGAYFIPGIGEVLITATIIAAVIGLAAWLIYKICHITANVISKARTISRADAKVRATVQKKSKTRYWSATLKPGYANIGKPLTYSQAVK